MLEEMQRQKRDLLFLAEGLRRISDKYDRTEDRIMESDVLPAKAVRNK